MNISHMGLALSLILGSAASASAMPLASATTSGSADAQIIQVRGGCGFGEHRGPYGGCRINHGWRGRIRASETGLPRGCPPGRHRGFYGRCHY